MTKVMLKEIVRAANNEDNSQHPSLLCDLLFSCLNLDPGEKVAVFGLPRRCFKRLLHQGPPASRLLPARLMRAFKAAKLQR